MRRALHVLPTAVFFSLGLAVLAASGCAPTTEAVTDEEANLVEQAELDAPLGPVVPVTPMALPTGYYDRAMGKTGADLLAALADRTTDGHRSLSYNDARQKMFSQVEDPDGDDAIDCVYTGRIARSITSTSAATSADFNTEHTWPQSLGATGPAQSDLHHLWASDEMANNRRANYPFGVVSKVTWTAPNPDGAPPSKLGTDSSGRTVFEPHDGTKGDIARSIFYFYTRYATHRTSKFTLSNFNVEEATLRQWHAADPPDANEQAHNDLSFAIQGNRNPYIDHPEWVAAIPDFP